VINPKVGDKWVGFCCGQKKKKKEGTNFFNEKMNPAIKEGPVHSVNKGGKQKAKEGREGGKCPLLNRVSDRQRTQGGQQQAHKRRVRTMKTSIKIAGGKRRGIHVDQRREADRGRSGEGKNLIPIHPLQKKREKKNLLVGSSRTTLNKTATYGTQCEKNGEKRLVGKKRGIRKIGRTTDRP